MKILQIVARVPSPPVDGGAMYVHYLTENLLRDGHDVHLAGFTSNKHPQNTEMLDGAQWHLTDGKYRKYYPWAFIGSELQQLPVTISHRMNRTLFRSLLDEMQFSPEIILLEGVFVGHFISVLRRKFPGVPIVLRSSNVEYQVLERNARVAKWPFSWIYARQANLMKAFEYAVMQQIDGLTAITSRDKEVLAEMNPNIPSAVVTAGTTFPGPPNPSHQRAGVIGCIADWSWEPNRDGLTWFIDEIWPKLKSLQPDLKMEVAGGKMSSSQQVKLEQAGITYLGFVESADIFRQSLSV
ncbi:MAG: glycosyltransferase, partial [Balneolales bacterium]|nr:glycosyltransferase [Balneolales bacterium]